MVVRGEIFKQQTGSEGGGCCMGKEGRPAGHQSGRGGCWKWRAGSGSGFGEHADEAGCLVAPPAPLTSRPRFWIGPFLIDHRHI